MGFDIECIVDIQSYPGEYFCPVCRTLVFPNEAHQAQCTHLYCKPCLAHVANGSRACPYDGYLVTEADSKLLNESDKTLAENIGKVKVRCLYHRSGCTWEGPLSDCTSHCSGCTFGNSPVVCNRCGVQIVHRQVNDHAQICSGVFPAQQAASGVPSSGAAVTAAGAAVNQTQVHSAPQTTTVALPPGQNPNQQTNASSQPAAVASAAVPTSEQQWQQYYQQYAGYDPYQQQSYQQYYPYQQQPVVQYQQPQVYMQPQVQLQTPVTSQPQSQAQPQPLNSQLPPPPPPQPQAQPQVQAMAQQHQNLVQANQQQQIPPTMQPNIQIPSQVYPTSHAQPPTQPPAYPQHYPMQHNPQVPQYQHPPAQLHPQQSSQAQPHPFLQSQPHSQVQPQMIVQHHLQSHGQLRPPQAGQPAHVQAQTLHSTANTVSGFNSYPQPQSMQQMPVGVAQQPPIRPPPTGGSMPPVQTHGQVPQQPSLMRPLQGPTANQQPGLIPSQGQAPVQSQIHSTAQQAGHSVPQHPIQPNQQLLSQQYSQQQAFPGAYPGQSHQQGNFMQQQPLQTQLRPQGPNVVPQNSHLYVQPQQNVALPSAPQLQQSQTYTGRPGMQNHVHSFSQAHGAYYSAAQVRPVQPASGQPQMYPSYGNHMSNENDSMDQKNCSALESQGDQLPNNTAGRPEAGVPSLNNSQKDLSSLASKSVDAMAPRYGADLNDEQQKLRKTVDEKIVKEEGTENSLELRSASKSADVAVKPQKDAYDDAPKEQDQSLANHASSDAADGSIPGKSTHKNAVDRGGFHHFGHEMPPPKYGPSAQQRPVGPTMIPPTPPPGRAPRAQVPGYSSNAMVPSGDMAQADQTFNSGDHRQSFMKQSGPGSTAPFGRGPGQFPPPGDLREGIVPSGNSVNPAGPEMFQNQRVNRFDGNQPNLSHQESFENIPFGQHSRVETVRDKGLKAPMGEHLRSLPVPHDQASRSLDKPPRGFGYDSGSKLEGGAGGPPNRLLPPYDAPGSMRSKDGGEREPHHDDDRKRGGPGFGMHKVDYFSGRNPDREFFSIPPRGFGSRSGFEDIGAREPHQFNEGSRPFNAAGGFDGRFQPFPGHSDGSEVDGHRDLRGNELTTFGRPYSHVRGGDVFGKDMPSHMHRLGEPTDFGPFAGHGYMGELSGPADFPGFGESLGRSKPGVPQFGEPGFRSRYPNPGFPNDALYAGDLDSGRPRKRMSMGWCRICNVDCETVEGLDMHSQTREHQEMAMDMVRAIKEQNRKQQKLFINRGAVEVQGKKSRRGAFRGRGRRV